MIRKFTLFSSFVFFMMIGIGHINALAQSVTATATNAACPDEGKITATTSGFTGVVGYQLKQGSTIVRPQGGSGFQSSNIFEGLPAGTYTVVADNGTSNSESSATTVTINYSTMTASVAPATVSCGTATKSLTVVANGGSGNYLYAMTAVSETNVPATGSFQTSPTFPNLAVGSYKFWIKDQTCTSATIINTTGAVNNVPAPDATAYSLSAAPLLSFATYNNHLSGYRVTMARFIRSNVAMSAADAASYTVEIRNGATVIAGPIAMPSSGGLNISVPAGLESTPLTVVLKNTCTGNTNSFPVSVVGPSMTVLASCPGAQAMYRIMANSIVSLPATITYTNQDGSGVGNRTITRTAVYDDYVYVDFPSGTKYNWKIVDAKGQEWTGTHDFTVDLIATTSPSQWTSYVNNCAPNSGTIELIMRGLKNNQTLGFRIISAPIGSESLVGMVGTTWPGWKNDYTLVLNGSNYFPKGAYRIEFIDGGCYNGRQMNVTAQGRTASVTGVQTTANCGSFNFKLAGTYDANFQQYIISGPAGTAGLTKTNTETFTNMPYGTYKVALRVIGVSSCNVFVQDFTYTAESSIDFDVLSSGGFTCTTGGTGDLIVTASTTIPGATLEYSKDNGATWQTSNIFPNLPEGTYNIVIKENGCGNQRTVSATVTANLAATINNHPTPSTACVGENAILNINAIGGSNYTWTYPDGSTHSGKVQTITNVAPAMAGTYSVVVQSASCTTPPQQVSLKVTTKPTIDVVSTQTACNGIVKTINLTGTAGREYTSATTFTEINTVYSWTNDNPTIGLAASGQGNISFTPVNTGSTPIVANISVTAQGATGCDATTINFSITVNPDSKITLSSTVGTDNQEKCINEAITDITYTVTNGTTATATGLPTGLIGAYNAGVFTISGTATQSGTFNYTVNVTGDCLASATSGTIKINPSVQIALSSAAATATQNVNINTAITNITYSLTNGATGATVTGLPTGVSGNFNAGTFTISGSPTVSGTYNYMVTSTGGCGSATLSGQIIVNANAAIVLASATGTNNQTRCISTPLVNIDYNITNGTNAAATGLPTGVIGTYTAGNFKITGTPTVSGVFNYTITVTGPGAPATTTGTITVTPNATLALSSATGTNAQIRCINVAIANISYAVTNGTGATVAGLPTGVTGTYNAGVFTISGTPSTAGTFNYTITTSGGCSSANATGTITVTPNATLALSSPVGSNQQAACINTGIANITYSATNATAVTVSGLPAGITSSYSGGILTIQGAATTTGTFNYVVTATGNCANATANGTIVINSLPVVTISNNLGVTSISKGDILTLTATGGTTYVWSGADIQGVNNAASINVRPKQTSTYTVKVTNASGCTIEQNITINVIEDLKLIPNNIITPNGDGKNDLWTIRNIDYYPNNKVSVYDRAGRRVFAATGYQNNWDGNYAGAPLAEGAYFYVIDMGNCFGLIRGTINIIRDRR